jgi:predicted ribosome quality control (RQC) complex YloA/Tae2 family protein
MWGNITVQQVDFTTLTAIVRELQPDWVPARVENVYQRDRYTIFLGLRTLYTRGWLAISWHPQAARVVVTTPPPRIPDTFTFSQQLRSMLGGLALVDVAFVAPWERLLDFRFAKRPGEEPLYHLYVEIMGKYSNVTLTDANNLIITTAHQVSSQQSSVRTIQTGQTYELPPSLTDPMPNLEESFDRWRDRVRLIPDKLNYRLVRSYRGLSTALVNGMIGAAGLNPTQTTDTLSPTDWESLFQCWQKWLRTVEQVEGYKFCPVLTKSGYSVLGWGVYQAEGVDKNKDQTLAQKDTIREPTAALSINQLINYYYTQILDHEEFNQLCHQLTQKLTNTLGKLRVKANTFKVRLEESTGAEEYKAKADLLMAHLHEWTPGMQSITLLDFETEEPLPIPLEPDKNAIQNAQALYKRHQKLKRAKSAVEPLLAEVQAEIDYLEQVEGSILQVQDEGKEREGNYTDLLQTLLEIKEELINTGYIKTPERIAKTETTTQPYSLKTPSGFELLVGRNNKQNDFLTFKLATDYDLWFHTQQIAGSHGLLRIPPGEVAQEQDLQSAANAIAYYSRGRNSQTVPVIYTQPKHVYKPKGAKPGMVIYKHEKLIWGYPHRLG